MKRGELWWASLPSLTGFGPGFRRPVLVVQSQPFNESRIATVVVAIVTSNLGVAAAPGNVRLRKSDAGLPKISVINVSRLITLDRSLLTSKGKPLSGKIMSQVDEGLRLVLALQ